MDGPAKSQLARIGTPSKKKAKPGTYDITDRDHKPRSQTQSKNNIQMEIGGKND